jgi:hypothetical protein
MNPFSENRTVHNTWPVILVMYNLPTWLYHKRKYRKMKSHFDNTVEKDSAPKQYTRNLVFEMVKNIEVVFEKGTLN